MADQVERAADDDNARWFPSDDPPRRAFAHNVIVDHALWRLGAKREYSRIAHALLSETFRRDLHEAVLQGLSIPLIPDGRSRRPSCRPMSLSRAAGTAHGASIAPTPAPGSSIMVRSGAIKQGARVSSVGAVIGTAPGGSCAPGFADGPWTIDLENHGHGPGSSVGDAIPTGSPRQGQVPVDDQDASDEEPHDRIRVAGGIEPEVSSRRSRKLPCDSAWTHRSPPSSCTRPCGIVPRLSNPSRPWAYPSPIDRCQAGGSRVLPVG